MATQDGKDAKSEKAEKDASKRRIVGGVTHRGRLYRAGDEAALADALPAESIARLVEKGALAGEWEGSGATRPSEPSPKKSAKKRGKKRGKKR